MRAPILLTAALLAGCADRQPKQPDPPDRGTLTSLLATPVVAPMVARDRLLDDLEQQQRQARERAATCEDAIGRDH